MNTFDKILLGFIIGITFPIFFFLLAITIWFYVDRQENNALLYAVTGFLTGLIIDLKFLKAWMNSIFELPVWFIIGIYLFYNMVMFGFFMGVPIFHLFLGVIAGFYWTKRLIYHNSTIDYKVEITRVSGFTSIVIAFICLVSAIIALNSKSTPYDLKYMLHLPFDVSQPFLVGFIITGGLFLIFFQYWFTKITMMKVLKMNKINLH